MILFLVILFGVGQSVMKKVYSRKGVNDTYFFNAVTVIVATAGFALIAGKGSYNTQFIGYSAWFAAAYAAATVFGLLAISTGSLVKTALVSSYSMLVPTFYGIIFEGEIPGTFAIAGIILLSIAIYMTRNKSQVDKKISARWVIFVLICAFTNGMCGVLQRMQQSAFHGLYKNEFMVIALGMVSLVMLVASLVTEHSIIPVAVKKGGILAILCGVCNAGTNYLVMLMNEMHIPASIMFPAISAGGLVLVFLCTVLIWKEKYTKLQLAGYAVGLISVILLNL